MIAAFMGWMGTLGTMGAYVMLSRDRWHPSSLRYSALNGVGGLLGGTAGAIYGAWPCVGSNAIWTFVAVHAAVRTLQARRSQSRGGAVLPVTGAAPTSRAEARGWTIASARCWGSSV